MIGPENSRHFLNQSYSKLKSIATWSLLFSRAFGKFLLLTLDSNWLLAIFSPFLTGCCDYFGFILRHSMEMRFIDTDIICWRWDYRVSNYFERISWSKWSDLQNKSQPLIFSLQIFTSWHEFGQGGRCSQKLSIPHEA